MRTPIATLYLEELKATMRGRFAWLGAAAVLLAIGGLATAGTQDTWLDGYGIIAYGLVPLPAKREMWNLLRRLAADQQVTTFLSSHDAQEIRSLCSEISVLVKGRVVYTGPARALGTDLDAFEERLIELLTRQA